MVARSLQLLQKVTQLLYLYCDQKSNKNVSQNVRVIEEQNGKKNIDDINECLHIEHDNGELFFCKSGK